jgi:Ser/Thr protein kinase RdoA (MazF antagonist)
LFSLEPRGAVGTAATTTADVLPRLARAALSAYELRPDAQLTPIRLMNNGVFEVRTDRGGRFVLRVHRPAYRDVAHTRSELRFLEVLHEELRGSRVRVPRPVRTRDGELLVEVAVPGRPDERRHCDVLSWVDGRVLRPTRGLGAQGVHLLGEALARIHTVAEQVERSEELQLPRWDADGLFTEASPFRPGPLDGVFSRDEARLFQEVEERTRAILASLDNEDDAFGVINSDFILVNCHFVRRARGWELGVLDFDDLGWGYFLYDLCPLLGNLADYPRNAAMRRTFLAGYRSVRPLRPELERHLPVLMAARHMSACLWVVGIERTQGSGPPVAEHIAARMDAARQCLALAAC